MRMTTDFEIKNLIEFIEYMISKNGIIFEMDKDITEIINEYKSEIFI